MVTDIDIVSFKNFNHTTNDFVFLETKMSSIFGNEMFGTQVISIEMYLFPILPTVEGE